MTKVVTLSAKRFEYEKNKSQTLVHIAHRP